MVSQQMTLIFTQFVVGLSCLWIHPFLRRTENADIMCQIDQILYAKDGRGFQVRNTVWKYHKSAHL